MPLVDLELIDAEDTVAVGDWLPVRVRIERPGTATTAVELPAGGVACNSATINADLFSQNVLLQPGEDVILLLKVQRDTVGLFDLKSIVVQVNPVNGSDSERTIVALPSHSVHVVPAFARQLKIDLVRIYGLDDAVKTELTVRNSLTLPIHNFQFSVQPRDGIRSGPLTRRTSLLRIGEAIVSDLVVTNPTVEVSCSGSIEGVPVECKRSLAVPTEETQRRDEPEPFVFLEARSLSTDRIVLIPDGSGQEVSSVNSVFPVHGGKSRYRLTVYPSHPQATSVRLYPAAGQVEVEPQAKSGREWSFMLTIVENPYLTQLIRLDYDVQVSGTPLRGELYFSVRPTSWKIWGAAITAGLAVTVKGATAVAPAIAQSEGGMEGLFENVVELMQRRWIDWLQVLSIPLIGFVLWFTDRIWRPLQEG